MKRMIALALLSGLPVLAQAEVGVFVGVTYQFGAKGGFGVSVQALNTRAEDKAVMAAGVHFYPGASTQKFGTGVGLGYQGSNAAAIVGYDLINRSPTVSGGWSNTQNKAPGGPV